MFPNGVVYEGVSEEPLSFRGESGANDSMIPLCDNLLQVQMPDTPLTKILEDFRRYRPGNHREFLEYVHFKAREVGVRGYAMVEEESARRYLRVLDGVREFRRRHWCFTREYILRQTKYQRATGGSPIVRWLPNQLAAVLEMEAEVIARIKELGGCGEELEELEERVHRQKEGLAKEVERFLEERGSED
jgi:indoleamine 2,3-dioxygenase